MLLKPALGLPLDPNAQRPDAGSRRPLEEEMRACWSRRSLGPLGLFRTPVWLGKSPGFTLLRVWFRFQLVHWLPVTHELPLTSVLRRSSQGSRQ